MATTLSKNIQVGDMLIFNEIINYAYPKTSQTNKTLLKKMVLDGVLQIEILFEKAISLCANLTRESTVGRDFVDGSDAKKVLVQNNFEPKRNAYRRVGRITNLKNKQGLLRCIVSEAITGKVYYFAIPHYAYNGLRSISIYFNTDGTPKMNNKWFQFSCKNFKDMAEIKEAA